MNTRRNYYLGDEDDVAIESIKKRYGFSTDSDVVRFALRVVAANKLMIVEPKVTSRPRKK